MAVTISVSHRLVYSELINNTVVSVKLGQLTLYYTQHFYLVCENFLLSVSSGVCTKQVNVRGQTKTSSGSKDFWYGHF